ncbi:MAG: hypothetical protein WD273_05455 [Trueperaceae bacterium]
MFPGARTLAANAPRYFVYDAIEFLTHFVLPEPKDTPSTLF